MERKELTNEEFESLWQQAEAREHGRRLAEGYPSWQRRRRLAATGVAMCMVGIIAYLPLQLQQNRQFDKVYCNRASIPDSHWADVASEMLTVEMV